MPDGSGIESHTAMLAASTKQNGTYDQQQIHVMFSWTSFNAKELHSDSSDQRIFIDLVYKN